MACQAAETKAVLFDCDGALAGAAHCAPTPLSSASHQVRERLLACPFLRSYAQRLTLQEYELYSYRRDTAV